MNVASLELCRELYEVSGWDGTHIFYDAEDDAVESRAALLMHPTKNCPAYDLGYLLRKLPLSTQVTLKTAGCLGGLDVVSVRADTPEDAAAKLAIEIHKQNILTKVKE